MQPEPPSSRAVLFQLDRVLCFHPLARNERMGRFLKFVVEEQLAGRAQELKESVIAVRVFGRRADYDPKQDSIVRTEAARLRSRLVEYYAGQGRTDPVVINLPKGGYVPAFNWRTESATELAPAGIHRGARFRFLVAGMALAVVALLGIGSTFWAGRKTYTIAVLPLQAIGDIAGRTEPEIAEALTEEIIRHLAVVEGLVVRSRTSSYAVESRPRNLSDVGAMLDVRYVVEGSVQRDAERLRVAVQLVRVPDDRAIWTGRFDRDAKNLLSVQEEISRGIVNELRLNLGRGRWRYETNAAAYELYLRARVRGADTGMRHVWAGIPLLEEVVSLDPSFAPAHADLGARYAIRSVQYPLEHAGDELEKMRRSARRAVALDPLLAAGHTAVALAAARDADWNESEAAFQRAIALDPQHSSTRMYYATWLLNVLGRNDEALRQLRAAERADPLSADIRQALAWVLLSLGRPEAAFQYCEQLPPSDTLRRLCLGRALHGLGRTQQAVQVLLSEPNLAELPHSRGVLGYLLASQGRSDEAVALVGSNEPQTEALVAVGMGDVDRAFAALERMGTVGPLRVGQFLNYPEFRALASHSRMAALRRRVGLPD